MDTKEHNYRPYGNLEGLFYDKSHEILVEGPVRTGKTRAIIEKTLLMLSRTSRARALWVRKTKESMAESVLQTFEDHCLPDGHYLKTSGARRQYRTKYLLRNGSEIIIGGMDKTEKILSTEYDIICAFEATELTCENWEVLTTRANNLVMPYNQCIADCNPAHPRHWLNLRADTKSMKRLLSRLEDNPKFYDHNTRTWTEAGKTLVDKLDQLTGPRYLRLRRGLWAAAEGLVYPDFDPAIHVIPRFDIPRSWMRFRVIDFGYVNPFGCQWWALDEDGRAYMYREIYMTRRLVDEHAGDILALSQDEDIVATIADHDAEDRATLHKRGIITRKADKRLSVGLEAVSNRLQVQGDGRPRLFILADSLVARDEELADAAKPVCTEQEFANYCYPKDAVGREIKEAPMKVDDHGMDEVRYAMMYLERLAAGPPIFIVDTADNVRYNSKESVGYADLHGEESDDTEEIDTFDSVMDNEAAWRQ